MANPCRLVISLQVVITVVYANELITQCIDKTSEENGTLFEAGIPACTAERWCSTQWPEDGEKTAPKPRIHTLKYYIYKTKTGRGRNIGLRLKWFSSAFHYGSYVKGYSVMMFTLGLQYEFRICFDTNKTKIMKSIGSNQTMVKFSYDYACELSCLPINPGTKYYITIMTNPIYHSNLKRLHHRRSITIPGCDHPLIRRSYQCRGKKTTRRRKEGQKFHETTIEEQDVSRDVSVSQVAATPTSLPESGPNTEKPDHFKVIMAATGCIGVVGFISLVWFLLRKRNSKTGTSRKTVLFLEEVNKDTDSLHSLALQRLVTEINKQDNLTAKYSKWEMLKLVSSANKWLDNNIADADIVVMLLVQPQTTLSNSSKVASTDWMTETFFDRASNLHTKKKFIAVYFDNERPICSQFPEHTVKVTLYHLMEDLTLLLKVLEVNPDIASGINKNRKLHNLIGRIREMKQTGAKRKQQQFTKEAPNLEKCLKHHGIDWGRCNESR